ncbi:lpl-1 [Pristionchus pacificus]|uniref:lipoyl(octanoyl) transferase n=1 Tax=Pristionchus pacificus TaxID=54126 RepID=A0A8R1V2T7_PRIPA|nr:lpl-1 [Pristionchus pacificus]
MSRLSLIKLGTISYMEGLSQQSKFTNIVKQSIANHFPRHFLLLLEHRPVYTVGIRSNTVSDEEESRLKRMGADFHRTSRGGLITFHGPGQLVAYPILALKGLRDSSGKALGVRRYVEQLEECLIRTANGLGVKGVDRVDGLPGVWVEGRRKLASLGVSVQHGVTGHGLALNCDMDLTWFDKIVACGISGVKMTSLLQETLSINPSCDCSVSTVIPHLINAFSQSFHLDANRLIVDEDCPSNEIVIPRHSSSIV